jgi:hypothetical protein
MVISTNSGRWGVMVIRIDTDLGKLVKVALKKLGRGKG